MIRPAIASDIPDILQVSINAEMFTSESAQGVRVLLDSTVNGQSSPDHHLYVATEGRSQAIIASVYFGLDPVADRKWDLWMIAIEPGHQRKGVGGELLRFTEAIAAAADGRLMIIDTSSLAKYDKARSFYQKHGYVEVARIPDYYADAEDRVTFWKRLQRQPHAASH